MAGRGKAVDPTPDTLGWRLRRARRARKLTQAALAERTELEQATISKLETGDHQRGEPETVRRLAEVLGVDADWLLEGRGAAPPDVRAGDLLEAAGARIETIDRLLDRAFVAGRHSPTSIAFLRHALLEHSADLFANEPIEPLLDAVRGWLDAVDQLRAEDRNVTLLPILLKAAWMQGRPKAATASRRNGPRPRTRSAQ